MSPKIAVPAKARQETCTLTIPETIKLWSKIRPGARRCSEERDGGAGSATLSVVVQSDSAGIALVKQSVASQNSTLSGTVTNGDNHVGAHLCSFHVSKAGNSYDVDFYASGLPAGVTASDFCSTAVENAFLDGLPSS